MRWLTQNWFLILLIGGMVGMHLRHGGHGGHARQGGNGSSDAGESRGGVRRMRGMHGGGGCGQKPGAGLETTAARPAPPRTGPPRGGASLDRDPLSVEGRAVGSTGVAKP
ncbi:MAG: hypothetical protein HYX34_00180 [Actinobacteria bacterium]|nr:hypothetical protein [Actinomycetota bacterium]